MTLEEVEAQLKSKVAADPAVAAQPPVSAAPPQAPAVASQPPVAEAQAAMMQHLQMLEGRKQQLYTVGLRHHNAAQALARQLVSSRSKRASEREKI
jgi:hypothetical protein